jgi:hypothetical protein
MEMRIKRLKYKNFVIGMDLNSKIKIHSLELEN